MHIPPYVVLDKKVGETPLQCAEEWRAAQPPAYQSLPLAYAGRLDPMASGKLLVLIGDECKVQEQYHVLDKRYEFSVLLGVSSDTADVLGRLRGFATTYQSDIPPNSLTVVTKSLSGNIALPYPHFSAKTVAGKPLHTWALEGRLAEIIIPTQSSTVYRLTHSHTDIKSRTQVADQALSKINTIPPVTDARKALGNDFRRVDVRADWECFRAAGEATDQFTILHFACICSSGTYMRSLAEEIGNRLGNIPSLAYHIHRSHIGTYLPITRNVGIWKKLYK